jgi:hypothetical protein
VTLSTNRGSIPVQLDATHTPCAAVSFEAPKISLIVRSVRVVHP